MSLDSIFNFAPGYKRYLTVAVATALFALQQLGIAVPDWAMYALGIFGFNALAQAPKNT